MAIPPCLMADPTKAGAVFIIGMHIYDWVCPTDWLPPFLAMPRRMRELERNRDLGMVSARYCRWGRTVAVVQYRKSFEHLERYARNDEYEHRPAWLEFYRAVSKTGSTVGIFHETDVVAPGATESLYFTMPPDFGLTGVTGAIPVHARRETAHERLHASGEPGPQA